MWVVHVVHVLCPSVAYVLEMSVVRGMRGVGVMCMCLARGGVGGEGVKWIRGLGLGFTNPVGTGGVCPVFWLRWCGCCMWRVGRGGQGSGGWCYVCVRCESGLYV